MYLKYHFFNPLTFCDGSTSSRFSSVKFCAHYNQLIRMSNILEEANFALKQYLGIGVGADTAVKTYSEHGAKYEEYMKILNYQGPKKTAETAAGLLKDNYTARILDIGAGSGLVAEQLSSLGYKTIDAVDASKGLLSIARVKGLYGKIICQFVGHGQPLPIEDNSYDMVVICGAMGENHIPKAAFSDIIRVVKSGGFVVNVFREEALYVPWYEDGLQPYMNQLENDGLWKEIIRTKFPVFIADKEGLVLVHKVL
ncbi:hypothetical protein Btru_016946 [Bulinus truncatus]|nr:hypothetical protein Btru_016946 [Bulinus truncatus]